MKTEATLEKPDTGCPPLSSTELLGRCLPSARFGAWTVNEVRGSHTRLVSANLRHEKWMLTSQVIAALKVMEFENDATAVERLARIKHFAQCQCNEDTGEALLWAQVVSMCGSK